MPRFQRPRKLTFRCLVLLLLSCGGIPANAQQNAAEVTAEDAAVADATPAEPTESATAEEQQEEDTEVAGSGRPIEQITVTSEQSFFLMRSQIEAAEEALYSTYNDFNEDDDFTVVCRKTNWTHTRIQEQQCWPKFFDDILEQENSQFFLGGSFDMPISINQLANMHSNRFEELRANIMRVAQEHPEVAEALLRKGYLEQVYEEKRAECMEKDPAFLLFRRCP